MTPPKNQFPPKARSLGANRAVPGNLGKVTLIVEFKRRSRAVRCTPPNYNLFAESIMCIFAKG